MGYYINPKNMSKEEWLSENHSEVLKEAPSSNIRINSDGSKDMAVVLVDNGAFTAAGVAYSQDELNAFTANKNDHRPKIFLWVPLQKIEEVLGVTLLQEGN